VYGASRGLPGAAGPREHHEVRQAVGAGAGAADGGETSRLRQIEATVAAFRAGIAVAALAYTVVAPESSRGLLVVAAGLLGASALATGAALRLPVGPARLRLVGLFVVATDVGLVTIGMLAETTGPEQGLYLAGILVVLEAAVRWGRLGGVAVAAILAVSLGVALASRSAREGAAVPVGPLVMRSGLYAAVGLAVGHTVRVLDDARADVAARLAASDLVAQVALEASRRGSAESVRLLARMLHETLGLDRVAVLGREPADGLRPGDGAEAPGEPAPVALRLWALAGYPPGVEAQTARRGLTVAADHPLLWSLTDGEAGAAPGPGPSGLDAGGLPELLVDPLARHRLAVPLRAAGRPVGVLLLQSRRDGALGSRNRRLLESLAAEVGQILGHVELAEAQARALHELERLAAAKDEFLAVASHELRTPVTALIGFARILEAPPGAVPPEGRRQAVEAVVRQAQRLGALVEDLLAATRLDAGSEPLRREVVVLSELLREGVDDLPTDARGAVRVSAPDGLAVMADARALRRVLANLLDNATRYAPGPIDVEACAGDDGPAEQVHLVVADRGPGIPPSERSRIFERFERGTTAVGDGTGLGLSIVRSLVEAMGGRITVEDREGGGARFVVRLPAAPPRPGPATTSTSGDGTSVR
jgi:signal transduction histidine kinase